MKERRPVGPPLDDDPPAGLDLFSRYGAMTVQVVVAALLIWVGAEVVSLRDDVSRLDERTKQNQSDILSIKAEIVGLRSSDSALVEGRVTNATRLQDIEARLANIERDLQYHLRQPTAPVKP